MNFYKILFVIAVVTFTSGCIEVKFKSNEGISNSYNKDLIGCWEMYKEEGIEPTSKPPISTRLALVKDNGVNGYAIAYPTENGFAVLKGFTIETSNGNFLCYQINDTTSFFINRYEISGDKNTFILFEQNQKELERLLDKKLLDGDGGMLRADNIKKLTEILTNYGKNIFSGKQIYFRKLIQDTDADGNAKVKGISR